MCFFSQMSLYSFGIFVLCHAVFSISSCQGLHFNEHQIATLNHPIVTTTVSVPAVSSGRFQNSVGFDISFSIAFALIMLTLLMKPLCCCPSPLFCLGLFPLAAELSLWWTYACLSYYPRGFYLILPLISHPPFFIKAFTFTFMACNAIWIHTGWNWWKQYIYLSQNVISHETVV